MILLNFNFFFLKKINILFVLENIFYALETLNKSYICLDNIEGFGSLAEMSRLSLFLQKAIEYYKVYKNLIISEKIKKLNEAEIDEKNLENEATHQETQKVNGKEPLKNEENKKNAQNELKNSGKETKIKENEGKKRIEVESKVKQFIAKNGVNERKIDDLTKMKKESMEIKDQNSKLHWEIERDVSFHYKLF